MIGIDASRALASQKTGTETYTFELLQAMAELDPPDDVELYLNARAAPVGLPNLGAPLCMPAPRLWTHLRLSARMAIQPPGVLFVPAHVVPAVHPRTVAVIHDLGYLHFPDSHPKSTRRMLDLTTRWSAHAARAIIAISDATKRDLIESYNVQPEKITVIHHGVSPRFHPRPSQEITQVLERLQVRIPYILTVGTYQPRKNLGRLAAAMSAVESAGLPHTLVIAGKRGWLADQVDAEIAAAGQADRVQTLGYVASDDLPALYTGASAFCLSSLYEGFGMPVLEAMASGTPVIASNSSALAEVAGNAAMTVDPTNVAAIGASLVHVLSSPGEAESLQRRGFERAAEFTWKRTAETTLALLRSVRDAI